MPFLGVAKNAKICPSDTKKPTKILFKPFKPFKPQKDRKGSTHHYLGTILIVLFHLFEG
jgi:hypothetical protein